MEAYKLSIAESLPEIVAEIATYPDAVAAHDLLKRRAGRLLVELARINADSLSAMTTLAAMMGRR